MASYEDGDVEKNNDNSISNLMSHLKGIQLTNESKVNVLINKAIPEELKDIESPFLWHSQQKSIMSNKRMIQRPVEIENELKLDNPEFYLKRYSLLLKLVLEWSLKEQDKKVKETMETINSYLDEDRKNECPGYVKYELLLKHLVSATEANLLALKGQKERSLQIAKSLVPTQNMPISIQAGLCAMKAYFLFPPSGYDDIENAVVGFAKEALTLEPDNHEWMILLANKLRLQRMASIPFSIDTPKGELDLLEKAIKLKRNSQYLHYLARAYMEYGTNMYKQIRTKMYDEKKPGVEASEHEVEKMLQQSLELYEEAWKANPENAANLQRVGYGLMKLPGKFANYDSAIDCLLKSLNLSYSPHTLQMIGTYYHRYGNDNKKALEYFEEAVKLGSHAGLFDMVRIKFLEDPQGYDPCPDLEKGLEWDLNTKNQCRIIAQLASYFLFIKRDFLKCIEYCNELIVMDKYRTQITVFKSLFLIMYKPVDLTYYIMNEAMLFCEENKSADEEKMYVVVDLIVRIGTINPELTKIKANPQLIPDLLKSSNKRYRKDSCVRGGARSWRDRSNDGGDVSRVRSSYSLRNKTNQANEYRRQTFENKREKDAEQENWRKH